VSKNLLSEEPALNLRLIIATTLGLAAVLIGCTSAVAPATTAPPSQPTTAPTDPPATATYTLTPIPPTDAPSATATEAPTETPTTAPTDAFITYQDFEIVPAETTLSVGARVIFQIKGAPGNFHQPYNFDAPNTFEAPPNLGDGATFAYTFSTAGRVTIRCGYHPDMIATVVVTP
jgi:plastocyanin